MSENSSIKEKNNENQVKEPINFGDDSAELFNKISTSTLSIIQGPVFKEGYQKLENAIGKDATDTLIGMLSVAMTTSAYNAVVQYHNSILEILQNESKNIEDSINAISAQVNGVNEAVKVLRAGISDIKKQNIIDSVSK